MSNFLPIKSTHRAASRRGAARLFSIMILAFLWPARGGAVDQTPDLDVSKITDVTTLTYKKETGTDTYAWYYKIGTGGSEEKFSGTLTGSEKTDCPVITLKSEKEATAPNYGDCAKLILNGVKLTAVDNASLFIISEETKPLCIQAISESTLKCKATDTNSPSVIKDTEGGILLLDGGDAGLNIIGEGGKSHGIYLFTSKGSIVNGILKGKINIVADDEYAVSIGNSASLSAVEDAKITASAGSKAILDNNVKSSFLRWEFEAAPEPDKTLEIKDAGGMSFATPITFTTDDQKKSFAINVKKDAGYTVWLGNKKLMDKDGTTVFTATDDKLFSFSGMQTYLAKDWPDYGQTVNVGADGTDVAVSGANYTVKTACGLAWIAWVTNNGKIKEGNADEMYTAYYPASAGFAGCTVTLAGNISLATPPDVAGSFNKSWYPIGKSQNEFKGTFDGGGHTVSDLSITSFNETLYFGLFGYIANAVIKNLRVAGEIKSEQAITGTGHFGFGGIAGYANKSKIIACSNAVEIDVEKSSWELYIGGVAGVLLEEGVINNCWNEVPLSGKITGGMYNIGGIVGKSQSGSISNCYSLGNVSGSGTNTSNLPCAIGGIIGWLYDSASLSNCYATGSVSASNTATGKFVWAGGIAGCYSYTNYANGTILQSTISNCLALNAGSESMISVIATGGTAHIGRILGESSPHCIISGCYASSKIKLKKEGNDPAAPTEDIARDKINGQSLFLDEVSDSIAAWAGPEDTKAFTAIGTDADGLLPRLKAIVSIGDDHLPTQYSSSIIPDQPTASMKSTDYLVDPDPLSLPAGNTETITLSCSNGKWSYKQGSDETLTRFNGTVKMAQGASTSTNKLVIDTATGNPTLTFEKVDIKPTDGIALTIEPDCELTINTTGEGTSTLSSSDASTLVNKGSLTLTGKGVYIGNSGNNNEYYGLDNSGSFTVTHSSSTSVTFHCANAAIHNTGTLANAWMEWQFAAEPGGDGRIAFAATDDNQALTALLRQGKTFATTVTAGKTYKLWKVTNATGEVRTRQKGLDGNGKPVNSFSAVANAVTVYTEVEDLKKIEITDTKNFSEADCAAQDVVVKSNGVLTVDADNAFVFNLELESGAQLVTRKALKVSETFKMPTRTLENKWITFGSPVALTASVGNASNLLCAATGYTSTDAKSQGWDNLSGTTKEGTETADLAADTPYLLAAEDASTEVTFTATAPADKPIEIPKSGTVTLGEALANGTFLFQTNPNLADLTLSGIYVLNDEGTRFMLKTGDYVVKPFEAFIVANAVTRARVASLRVGGDIATGNEQPVVVATTRIWGTLGMLHINAAVPADVMIVTPAGQTRRTVKVPAGDTTLALPAGIYFVRCNGITYKVSL